MSNVDGKTRAYLERRMRLEQEKREVAESIKDLKKEMKAAGFSKADVAGIELRVKREYETEDKAAERKEAEEIAEALGDMATTPLGAAAVSRAAPKPRMSAPPPCDDEFDPGPALPFGSAANLAHPAPH